MRNFEGSPRRSEGLFVSVNVEARVADSCLYTVVSAGPHMLRMPTSEGHWRANRRAECRLTPASDARDASKTRPKAPLSTGAQPLEGPVRHRYRCVRASRELPEDD